tara:strand:- start:1465 stop:2898 length:1434 start_codon:yes stop_codon:yes gene_type:complete
MSKITPILLCGGSGKRLWPISRRDHPKQFAKILDSKSLFQNTLIRLARLTDAGLILDKVIIVTNESHRFLAQKQIEDLKLNIKYQIILEPIGLNTAPSLLIGSLCSSENKGSKLIVIPSDHNIKNFNGFSSAIIKAIEECNENTICVLGSKPEYASNLYGYIEHDGNEEVSSVKSFIEKPTIGVAEKMLKDGGYSWNSGIFILTNNLAIKALSQLEPKMYSSLLRAWNERKIDGSFIRPDSKFFSQSPSNSIDYSLMEKYEQIHLKAKVIKLDAGWSDLGSFNSLADLMNKDENNNAINNDIVSYHSSNNIVISSKKLITLLDVKDMIVIETDDIVLVADRKSIQSMNNLLTALEEKNKNYLIEHPRVHRPWGWYETIDEGNNYKVKKLHVYPKSSLSYQSHNHRNEHWVVVKGLANVVKNDVNTVIKTNESIYIEKKVKHRLSNSSPTFIELIEVQTGSILSESDIERYSDIYGRL